MKGVYIRFYTYELQKHHNLLMYEWLLECAKNNGIHGGCAFKAIAGYGRHGKMHEEHFFELASDVPVEVVFIMTEAKSTQFLKLLKKEKINLIYSITAIEYGSTNGRHKSTKAL